VQFPGAKKVLIYFDPKTSTEKDSDYVRFYKDERHVEYYGESAYSGCAGKGNWPGCGGRPPLVIDSDSFVVYFHSDSTGNDWGYKFQAMGRCRTEEEPPPLPPILHISLLASLKLSGLKAFKTLLNEESIFVSSLIPLMQSLVQSSIYPLPAIGPSIASVPPLILESDHPYGNSRDDYIPVVFYIADILQYFFLTSRYYE